MEIGANGALNANLGGLTPDATAGANGQNLLSGASPQQLQGLLSMLSQLAPGLGDSGNTASSSAGADAASNPLEKLINLLRALLEKLLNPQGQNQSGAQDSAGSGFPPPSSPSPSSPNKCDGGRNDSHGGRDSGGSNDSGGSDGPGGSSPGGGGDCSPGDAGSAAGDCGGGDSGASGCGDSGGDGGDGGGE